MADFRSVKCSMWREDDWFQSLDADERLLFIYLFTNPSASVAGIYKLPLRTIAFESGIPEKRAAEIMARFARDGKAFYESGVVWVRKMREHQLPGIINSKLQTRLAKDVELIPDCALKTRYLQTYQAQTPVPIPYPYPTDTISIPFTTDTDTDTDTDTEEEERLPAPTTTAPKAVDTKFQERTQMTAQYQAVLGAPSTAIYPEMIDYMKRLQDRDSVSWWSLALTETTSARRPGWQYMKAVLESWLAAGKPAGKPNGAHAPTQPTRPLTEEEEYAQLSPEHKRQVDALRASERARAAREGSKPNQGRPSAVGLVVAS